MKRLLCSWNFSTNKPTFKKTKCGKSCFSRYFIIEGELFKFKNWHQPFILKSNFNCETSNLICAINSSWCNNKHIGPTAGQFKERLSFYRKHIRQREYDKIEVEKIYAHVQTEYLNFFPFFKMKENNKIWRKCCENNLIKKFKLELNRRLWNTKNWRQFQKVTWMNFRKNNCSK